MSDMPTEAQHWFDTNVKKSPVFEWVLLTAYRLSERDSLQVRALSLEGFTSIDQQRVGCVRIFLLELALSLFDALVEA